MMPGPQEIYVCLNCQQLLKNDSLESGNTFGSILWSDGKFIAPMLPDYPILTKCPKCKSILWLDKMEPLKEVLFDFEDEDLKKAVAGRFLTLYEYISIIKKRLFVNDEDELFIRQRILWGFHDRVRNKQPKFKLKNDEKFYFENIERCIEILLPQDPEDDQEKINQNIFLAELYRLQGVFELCVMYMYLAGGDEIDWIKDAFIKKCKKKDSEVFQLKQ
jgi:hypothetical protein